MNYKKLSLFPIIGLIVVVTVTLVMAVHAVLTYYSTKQHIVNDTQIHARTTLVSLQSNIAIFMSAYTPNEYEKLVANEMAFEEFKAIVVSDRVLGSVLGQDEFITGKIRNPDGSISDFDVNNPAHQKVLQTCYLSLRGPILSGGGGEIGDVTVCATDEAVVKALHDTVATQLINAGALTLVLILLLFITLYRIILQPLAHISNSLVAFNPNVPQRDLERETFDTREIDTLKTAINIFRRELQTRNAELDAERTRFQLAIEGSQDGLWDWDPRDNKVFFSKQWKNMLGYEDQEIGDSLEEWSTRVHPDDMQSVMRDVQDHLDGKTDIYENKHRVKCKDGSWKWILDRGKALFNDQGKAIRVVGFHTDITREMAHQHELKEARDKAELASVAKSEFLANMSHELRTPLNSIIGFSEMMSYEIKGPLPDDYNEYAHFITNSGRLLLETINSILDLSKIEAGKLELYKEDVFMGKVIDDVCHLLEIQAQQKSIRIHNKTHNLHSLYIDPLRIRQVLINLIGNSIKFSDVGEVEITSSCDEHGHNIIIKDHGVGMSDEQLAVAFEPFRQVHGHAMARKYHGTGLGLSFSRQVMQLHGGTLTAESTPGKGTMMTMHFPSDAGEQHLSSTA